MIRIAPPEGAGNADPPVHLFPPASCFRPTNPHAGDRVRVDAVHVFVHPSRVPGVSAPSDDYTHPLVSPGAVTARAGVDSVTGIDSFLLVQLCALGIPSSPLSRVPSLGRFGLLRPCSSTPPCTSAPTP